jgi:hypothetical protein
MSIPKLVTTNQPPVSSSTSSQGGPSTTPTNPLLKNFNDLEKDVANGGDVQGGLDNFQSALQQSGLSATDQTTLMSMVENQLLPQEGSWQGASDVSQQFRNFINAATGSTPAKEGSSATSAADLQTDFTAWQTASASGDSKQVTSAAAKLIGDIGSSNVSNKADLLTKVGKLDAFLSSDSAGPSSEALDLQNQVADAIGVAVKAEAATSGGSSASSGADYSKLKDNDKLLYQMMSASQAMMKVPNGPGKAFNKAIKAAADGDQDKFDKQYNKILEKYGVDSNNKNAKKNYDKLSDDEKKVVDSMRAAADLIDKKGAKMSASYEDDNNQGPDKNPEAWATWADGQGDVTKDKKGNSTATVTPAWLSTYLASKSASSKE